MNLTLRPPFVYALFIAVGFLFIVLGIHEENAPVDTPVIASSSQAASLHLQDMIDIVEEGQGKIESVRRDKGQGTYRIVVVAPSQVIKNILHAIEEKTTLQEVLYEKEDDFGRLDITLYLADGYGIAFATGEKQ